MDPNKTLRILLIFHLEGMVLLWQVVYRVQFSFVHHILAMASSVSLSSPAGNINCSSDKITSCLHIFPFITKKCPFVDSNICRVNKCSLFYPYLKKFLRPKHAFFFVQTDKASMLDEIIDYVKFLQLQVKVCTFTTLGTMYNYQNLILFFLPFVFRNMIIEGSQHEPARCNWSSCSSADRYSN